jgi:hypothetical protein
MTHVRRPGGPGRLHEGQQELGCPVRRLESYSSAYPPVRANRLQMMAMLMGSMASSLHYPQGLAVRLQACPVSSWIAYPPRRVKIRQRRAECQRRIVRLRQSPSMPRSGQRQSMRV